MRSTEAITLLLIGAITLTPYALFAEEGAESAGSAVPTSVAVPTTEVTSENTNKEKPVPTLYRESPSRPTLKQELLMRNAGRVATGTRAIGSSTRPLPALIEKRIEERDERGERKDERVEKRQENCVTAAGTTASGTDCVTREERKENRVEQKEERVIRRDERVERRVERRGEELRALTNLLTKRFNAAIERETKLADRIDSRITKLAAQGINTTTAEEKLVIAREKLALAKETLAKTTTSVGEAIATADVASSTANVAARKAVRDTMDTVKEAIMDAHKALVDAVAALKANIKATTTPETKDNENNN